MRVVFAHETWFTKGYFPLDWSFAFETLTLALLAAALVTTLAIRLAARLWPGADVPVLARLAPRMPVRVLREYERGVVFRFGRLVAQKGPGLVLLMPIADRMVRVTLRTINACDPAAGRHHS